MSEFLKSPDDLFSLGNLNATLNFYVLEEFKNSIDQKVFAGRNCYLKDNGIAVIQQILDGSNNKLRMYGSAEELAGNLKIFKNFPENSILFGTDAEPLNSDAIIYKSLKGEDYICKSDLFLILQNMTLSTFPGSNSEEIRSCITATLRHSAKKFENLHEFVKFDQKFFDEIRKELEEAQKICYRYHFETESLSQELVSGNFENLAKRFEKTSSKPNSPQKIREMLKKLYSMRTGTLHFRAQYMAFVLIKNVLMRTLPEVIDRNFGILKSTSANPIIRVFEDEGRQFVMKAELFHYVNKKSKKPKINFKDVNDNFTTIEIQEVFQKFEDDVKSFEFIRCPILRTKHRAVPIPGPLGDDFCILAIDAFFGFFKSLIFGAKFFQKHPLSVLQDLFFKKLEELSFIPHEKNAIFIKHKAVEEMHYFFQPILKLFNTGSAKDVRNAKKDGFTIQNLKNELAHLGLTTNFPEIQNHAEDVYSEVDKRKKEKFLRTCDLFDAIEHCQLNCILARLPNFKKFVHNQKGCHRVYGLKCDDCVAENAKNQESSQGNKLSILEKELAELKIAHQKTLEEKEQKSLEIEELQQKNLRLSVKNESNEVKLKQMIEQLAKSKFSIDDGKYSNPCTSSNTSPQKIQCLICEKSIESGENQIIRCPLCKRRFHSKCAINWLKEHKQCPACNGDLPKF
ncbi:hypothetical protein B9Z55_004347 [Caenorhabditis nigoni]|uniref:RING-type domain-containing protein n=1 Tax=Caenorhabditis nigoni TaxID=1611254 RepID=A0A2G5UWV5_9PELO|nr:hypothetical protein B9Z55_004347 [Caenorhabditis nigoni]